MCSVTEVPRGRGEAASWTRVAVAAVRGPQPALLLAGPAALDHDFVGDHEHRVEADAELADQLEVVVLLARELLEEPAGAGARDGAQVLDQVLAAHADAVVADRQQALGLVGEQADLQLRIVAQKLGLAQRLVAELVAGVGRVADQLAQEDLALLVERVDDQIEHTADIGLERLHGLGHGGGGVLLDAVISLGAPGFGDRAAGVQRGRVRASLQPRAGDGDG